MRQQRVRGDDIYYITNIFAGWVPGLVLRNGNLHRRAVDKTRLCDKFGSCQTSSALSREFLGLAFRV